MHLYLVGYRGSGKTTLAKCLSEQLGIPWFDSDIEVERAEGISIREIFDRHGETGFRDREVAAIERLSQLPSAIMALGGGAILRPKNRQTIQRTGVCVWLNAQPIELAKRIHGDATTAQRRPALTGMSSYDEIVSLLAQREPLYQEVSQLKIETDDEPLESSVQKVAAWYKKRCDEETKP